MATIRVYPSLRDISVVRGRIQAGEQLVYNWLCRFLNEKDEVLLQPYLAGRYPDAVVLRNGVLYVIEVKDYYLENFCISSSKWIRIRDQQEVSNPLIQVREYAKLLRLEISSGLYIKQIDPSLTCRVVPVIVFTNAILDDIHKLYERSRLSASKADVKRLNQEYRAIIGTSLFQESINDSTEHGRVELFNRNLGFSNDHDQVLPAIKSVWLSLKRSVVTNTNATEAYPLDAIQRRWIEHPTKQFKLHGVAGAGKTTVLVNRVARLSNSKDSHVLVLHNTNTLGNHLMNRLHDVLSDTQINNVTVLSLYNAISLIYDRVKFTNSAFKGSVQYLSHVAHKIHELSPEQLRSLHLPKYDAIMVDEVQDIDVIDLDIIRHAYLNDGGGWYLFGDVDQNTLGRKVDTDSLPRTNIPGRWGTLKRVYRSRGAKARVLQTCYRQILSPKTDEYELDTFTQQSLFIDFSFTVGVTSITVHTCEMIANLVGKHAASTMNVGILTSERRLAQCVHWSLCREFQKRLLPNPQMPLAWFDEQLAAFQETISSTSSVQKQGIHQVPWDIDEAHDFWRLVKRPSDLPDVQRFQSRTGIEDRLRSVTYGSPTMPTVSVGTLQLFKGLEFDTVIFIGSRFDVRTREHDIELWTAISRARSNVYVLLPPHSPYIDLLAECEGVVTEVMR